MNQLKQLYKKASRNDLIRDHNRQRYQIMQLIHVANWLTRRWLASQTDCEKCQVSWK